MKKLRVLSKGINASGESIINDVVNQEDLRRFVMGNTSGDKDTQKLLSDIYYYFANKLRFNSKEVEAWNRMLNSIKQGDRMDASYHRNNIFKAAHALGMKLPSSMF